MVTATETQQKTSKPISPTSTGGVFIHLSPKETMETQFKSLSPDYSVAELLAIKIKQEAIDLKGVEFDCYFNCIFNWKYITLGIYPNGKVYTMYSMTGFSSLEKVFGIKQAK